MTNKVLIIESWDIEAVQTSKVQQLGVQQIYVVSMDEDTLDTGALGSTADLVVGIQEVSAFLVKWEIVEVPLLLTYKVNDGGAVEEQERTIPEVVQRTAPDGACDYMKEGVQAFTVLGIL